MELFFQIEMTVYENAKALNIFFFLMTFPL